MFVPLIYSVLIIVFINEDISFTFPNLFKDILFFTFCKMSLGTLSVNPPSKYPNWIELDVIPYFEFSNEYVLIKLSQNALLAEYIPVPLIGFLDNTEDI